MSVINLLVREGADPSAQDAVRWELRFSVPPFRALDVHVSFVFKGAQDAALMRCSEQLLR